MLIFSTQDFKLNGMPYADFPLLLDERTGLIHEEALDFMIHHCIKRGKVKSVKSWRPFGQAMYDFFNFLQAYDDCDWRELENGRNSTIVAQYRDWSLTQCGLSASTVNQRLRFIVKFYQFALRQGWITSLPYSLEDVHVRQTKGFLAHVNAAGGVVAVPDIMLRQPRTTIKVLTKEQVMTLLKSIENPTHKLMVRLALATGIRREEIATFPLKYIFNPASRATEKTSSDKIQGTVRVHLNPQDMAIKNNHERAIDVPVALMADLWQYVLHERFQAKSIHGQKQAELFLNGQGRPFANYGAGLNKILTDLGLPFRVAPHMLRHTYATHTLYAMREKKSRTDPLLYVKNRLGHASIHSTLIYLHFLDEIEDDLMTDYQLMIDRECAI